MSPCSASTWLSRSREPSLQPATITLEAPRAQSLDMGDGGVEHIGVLVLPLGREIAPDTPAAIDDIGRARARLEGRQPRERRGGEPLLPFVLGQIEPRGGSGL